MTVCESVQGQDTLPGSRSINGVGVSECGQEKKMHSGGRGREGRCLIGSALKLGDYDLVERIKVGLSKRTKATSAPVLTVSMTFAQTPCCIKR